MASDPYHILFLFLSSPIIIIHPHTVSIRQATVTCINLKKNPPMGRYFKWGCYDLIVMVTAFHTTMPTTCHVLVIPMIHLTAP